MKDTTSKGHVLLGLDFLFNLIKKYADRCFRLTSICDSQSVQNSSAMKQGDNQQVQDQFIFGALSILNLSFGSSSLQPSSLDWPWHVLVPAGCHGSGRKGYRQRSKGHKKTRFC